MKLTLNCRDAIITQKNNPGVEFEFEFDLSTMNKPRLSSDTRMYIETLNLPEFFDEALGPERGKFRGYFELRCNNIDSGNNFDTEYGNTNNSIIFTSPLDGEKSFRNNDPMFISNFKINQAFLQNKLVLNMKIYDHLGDPFIQSYNIIAELASTITGDYVTKLANYASKKAIYDISEGVVNNIESEFKLEEGRNVLIKQQFNKSLNDLRQEVANYLSKGGLTVRQLLRAEQMDLLLNSYNVNIYSYIFEYLFTNTGQPYDYAPIKQGIINTRQDFVNLNISDLKLEKLQKNFGEVKGTEAIVFYDTTGVFSDTTISLKSAQKKKVNYSSSSKTGTVTISHFNSKLEKQSFVSIFNIEPTDNTDTHKLLKNEVLSIASTEFESIIPDPFEYFFSKHDATKPDGTAIESTQTTDEIKAKRYAIKISRSGTTYDFEILNKQLKPINFIVGDKIRILGSSLGGINGDATTTPAGNDAIITINGIYTPQTTEVFDGVKVTSTDGTDKGEVLFDITRDNTGKTYNVRNVDLTGSKNYNENEQLLITGDRLGGTTPANDLSFKINKVVLPERIIKIDQGLAIHKLQDVTINPSNSATSGGGLSYEFKVTCENGVYNTVFNSSTDTSSTFAANDDITIKGDILGGETPANDLTVKVDAVDGSGKITSLTIDPAGGFKGRSVTAFEFEVKITKDSPDYDIKYISGNNFVVGDAIIIDGTRLNNGATSTNDLTVVVKSVISDLAGDIIDALEIPIGIANFDTGDDGKILVISQENDNPFVEVTDGSFIKTQASITGTAVDVGSQTKPTLQITLNENPIQGLGSIGVELTTAQNELDTAKASIAPSSNHYKTTFGADQVKKMKNMNMTMVLYDEVDEYNQASQDAIKGNTYSRLQNCQFKRI